MNKKLITAFVGLTLLLAFGPASAETWKCDLIDPWDESKQHMFTRAGPNTYIHTTDVDYGIEGTDNAKTVTETRNFKVAAQTLLQINLVYSDAGDSPRYATLFSVGEDSPVAMLSEHVGYAGFTISQHGACKVACTREDRQRIVGSETVCDSY